METNIIMFRVRERTKSANRNKFNNEQHNNAATISPVPLLRTSGWAFFRSLSPVVRIAHSARHWANYDQHDDLPIVSSSLQATFWVFRCASIFYLRYVFLFPRGTSSYVFLLKKIQREAKSSWRWWRISYYSRISFGICRSSISQLWCYCVVQQGGKIWRWSEEPLSQNPFPNKKSQTGRNISACISRRWLVWLRLIRVHHSDGTCHRKNLPIMPTVCCYVR